MLTLFLEQLGFQFNLELLGPTVLQVIASSKESFFLLFTPVILVDHGKYGQSDLLCSRGGENHKSLVMDVSRRPRTSVLPVFRGAFCIILAT